MKKKLFSPVLILAMCTLLLSCGNDKDSPPGGEELTTMYLKLYEGKTAPATRFDTAPIGDGTAVTFNEGYLFFTNDGGFITKIVMILTTGSADNDNTVMYSGTGSLLSGVTLSNVPESSKRIHFVGNILPANVTIPPLHTDFNAFLSETMDILHQTDSNGGVDNVSLYGKGDISRTTSAGVVTGSASFLVYPIAARLELKAIALDENGVTADTQGTPSEITSFKVRGIFVNYFNANTTVDGISSKPIMYTSISYWEPEYETYYSVPYTQKLFDWFIPAQEVVPAAPAEPVNGVWAYNIHQADMVPHIILRLTDIQGLTPPISGDRYITVKGFMKGANDALSKVTGGEIYVIDEIPVHEDRLTDLPELEEFIDVKIEIQMMDWREVPVTPVIP